MIWLCGENDEKRAIREDKEAYILLIYLLKRMNHSSSSSLLHPLIRPKPHFFSLISIHIPPNNVISPQNNPEITPNSPSANYSLSPIIPPSLPSTLTTAIPQTIKIYTASYAPLRNTKTLVVSTNSPFQ